MADTTITLPNYELKQKSVPTSGDHVNHIQIDNANSKEISSYVNQVVAYIRTLTSGGGEVSSEVIKQIVLSMKIIRTIEADQRNLETLVLDDEQTVTRDGNAWIFSYSGDTEGMFVQVKELDGTFAECSIQTTGNQIIITFMNEVVTNKKVVIF